MRYWVITSLFLGMSTAPPAPPPIGWEERVQPGFDPPIEYVLVYEAHLYFRSPEKLEALLEQWGPQAVDALWALYELPEWKPYRESIWRLLRASHDPSLALRLEEKALQLLDKEKLEQEELQSLQERLDRLMQVDAERVVAIYKARLSSPEKPWHFPLFNTLYSIAFQHPSEALLSLLRQAPAEAEKQRSMETGLSTIEARLRAEAPMEQSLAGLEQGHAQVDEEP